MSALKCRFRASFIVPKGPGCRVTRTFKGTAEVSTGGDLVAAVIGLLSGIHREEQLGDVTGVTVRASTVRSRKRE